MANKRKANPLAIPIGIITLILAVVGLITVVKSASTLVKDKAIKAEEKQKYEKMLTPVVMFDPDPFDDLTKADKSQLLYSAIWSLLRDEEGISRYSIEQGGIKVPQADVEKAFIALYGKELNIASIHSTTDMANYDIVYDSALQSYIIPITGVEGAYIPEVTAIKKQGSSIILDVGYIGQKAWADVKNEGQEAPQYEKFMKITLRKGDGEMYIASIQNTDNIEVASKLVTTTMPDITVTVTDTSESETKPSGIPVTDENGEAVTDENGETLTTITETTAENSSAEESTSVQG